MATPSSNPVDAYALDVVAGRVPAGHAAIYTLCDGRETDAIKRVRYVGQTISALRRRLGGHVNQAKRGGQTHRDRWMRAVWASGADVSIEMLSVVPLSEWAVAERAAIASFKTLGAKLTNATDGGEGMPNPNAETRQRLREAFAGKPLKPEHRAKISASNAGRVITQAQRDRISTTLKGRPVTATAKAKMSATRKGRKFSPEHSAMIAAAKLAYYAAHPEARQLLSDAMRDRMRLRREAAL